MIYFGLIGKKLQHSFSKAYFQEKFRREEITDVSYDLFELPNLNNIRNWVSEKKLSGFNVTIPYKETIIPFLDELDNAAKEIGAVNCVKVYFENNSLRLKGYNTDYLAFKKSLESLLENQDNKALVFGTGGASKAVVQALKILGIEFVLVSSSNKSNYSYGNLKGKINKYSILINTTPVGMSPNIEECLSIPYDEISDKHLLYDLIYNPEETIFMKMGKKHHARTKNGLEMLSLQANFSWQIWTENNK